MGGRSGGSEQKGRDEREIEKVGRKERRGGNQKKGGKEGEREEER